MAFNQQEQNIIKYGLENGKSKEEITKAITNFRLDITTTPKTIEQPTYLQRVGEGITQSLQQAKKDITMPDSRTPLSKGISAVSSVTGAITTPITEAPVFKQAGELITKGIEISGEQLSKLYSPEYIASLTKMSEEEFQKEIQPFEDIQNLGNIANTILLARGGQKGIEKTQELINKQKSILEPKIQKEGTISQVLKDITPTKEAVRDRVFARAFKLAPVEDLSKIEQLTGNKPAGWVDKYNLFRNTPAETANAIVKFKRENINLVDDVIVLISEKFSFKDIPELKTIINYLKKDLTSLKSKPYQQVLERIKSVKSKNNFDLSDVQYIKKVFDDIESIYKKTGDVKEKIIAQDMAQAIAPVRRFVEDRVREVYPQIDIKSLNNNVQTSSAILDAIVKRAPKAETASLFQLGDMAVIGVGNQLMPGTGFAALFGKKIIESAPIQLRIAKWMSGKTKDLTKGMGLEDIKKAHKFIQEELFSSLDEPTINKLKKAQNILKKNQSKLLQK